MNIPGCAALVNRLTVEAHQGTSVEIDWLKGPAG